jgi:CRISPR-associated protein Cmr4
MQQPFLIHALSPLHAGTGHSAGVIDLPIARMAATDIPFAPGSGIKGVLRDTLMQARKQGDNDWEDWAFFSKVPRR